MAHEWPPTIHHVVRIMQDEFGDHLDGILWTGSRAYGEPRQNSDWDFFVVHDQRWRQRRMFTVAHDEIELFINPMDQIRREFAEEESATIGMFARGHIVFDRRGRMAALVEEARQRWESAPRLWTPAERDHWRYEALDLVKDIEDILVEDPDAASYLMGIAMQKVLEGWYRSHQYWEPKAKYVMADMAKRNAEMAFQCRVVISHHQSVRRRFEALQQLLDLVLKPLGGRLTAWETERELVAPCDQEIGGGGWDG